MYRFDLTGAELAESSGISMSQISRFKNGHNMRIDAVEALLEAMPPDARNYMLSLVAQNATGADQRPLQPDQEDPAENS